MHAKATTSPRFVAYYRVSTARQGQSGLGLEGQEAAVTAHVRSVGGSVVESFTEVETGKRKDRPELAKAIAAAKRHKATLIVAKMDRLARNLHFLTGLMEAKVDFVACDNPHANRLTVHILAAVAEDEARRISERTKAALAARKARGLPLGNPQNLNKGNSPAPALNKAKAKGDAERMRPIVEHMIRTDPEVTNVHTLTHALNAAGYTTPRGSAWHATTVTRLLNRLDIAIDCCCNGDAA